MLTFGSLVSSCILVLSPSSDPPVVPEEGSTAKTATLCPSAVRERPNVSMNVDLPAPEALAKYVKIHYWTLSYLNYPVVRTIRAGTLACPVWLSNTSRSKS